LILGNLLAINFTLKNLNLEGNHIADIGAKAIAEALKVNSRLKSLNLKENRITDIGAKALGEALKKNKNITNIDIRRNSKITEIGAKILMEATYFNTTLILFSGIEFRNLRNKLDCGLSNLFLGNLETFFVFIWLRMTKFKIKDINVEDEVIFASNNSGKELPAWIQPGLKCMVSFLDSTSMDVKQQNNE